MSGAFIIRRGSAADGPAMAKIINDWIDETEWMPRIHSHEAIEGFFTPEILSKRTILLGERLDGKIEGYLTLKPEGMIAAFYLAPAARGTGLANLMMTEAKRLHPDRLELGVMEPNVRARRFYEAQGFIEISEGRKTDTDEGIPELLMRWEPMAA
jgi:ribosomal protein S18 acetylase RimI-like enzyme